MIHNSTNLTKIYHSNLLDDKFLAQLKTELAHHFKDCKRIAVKMHFGELGNTKAFTPKDIKPITELLESMGFEHFLFDSSVMYGGPRANPTTHKMLAVTKGFRHVETGDEFIEVKGEHLTYQVCTKLTDADGVLVLTHVKGHVCSGFGGAIKNLGMGALTKKTKIDIHNGGMPNFSGKCVRCKECVNSCPIDGLKLEDGKEYPVIKSCYGCSDCSYACSHKVITPKNTYFDVLLAEGANAAQSKFKKHYYVSAIKNITQNCDCMPIPGEIIAEDAGWIMSPDGVAIDKAAYDLIVKKNGEVFLNNNNKIGTAQIFSAEKLGMGKKEYSLKEL
jgi:uncharacterized protein